MQTRRVMHASAFNLYIDDFPMPCDLLVHNTLSGALVVLEGEERQLFAQVRDGVLNENDRAAVHALEWSDPDIGIVVESLDAERESFRAHFEAQREERTLQALVCFNLSCNFACTYCCQADVMDGSVMSHTLVDQTADWLADRAQVVDADRVRVFAVGGEPLLYPDRIKALCARVMARLEPQGVEFGLRLITNGYLMSPELVQELLPYGLEGAQVTLDGDASTHALSRPSKKGGDTFQRIFENVLSASRHISIALNGNYQAHTISGFGPLVDALRRAGLGREHPISLAPAFEILSAPKGSVSGACTWSASPHQYRVALFDHIVAAGYPTTPIDVVGPCGFHSHHLFAVGPKGDVYKCPGFLGHPEWSVGHVTTGLTPRYHEMLAWDVFGSCGDCSHRPNCGGGCVAHECLESGSLQPQCDRPFLDEMASHALPRRYALATSDDIETAFAVFPAAPVSLPRVSADPASVHGVRSDELRVLQPRT